jgi:uncharacterized protein (TIGR03083 family)
VTRDRGHDHDHEAVRELLPAWAFGALQPGDERAVRPHLAECDSCAAEAERLRETVRVLDGPAAGSLNGDAPTRMPEAADVLALALRSRRPVSASGVAPHAAPYAAAVSALQALLRELDGEGNGNGAGRGAWGTPVVHDWDVHDTVAHLLAADEPLALRLGLEPRVPASGTASRTASPTVEGAGWEDAWAERTAEVIAHEQRRDPRETVATWAAQATALLATPEAHDPEPASIAMTLMGARLPVADHFTVRAFEAWIHTDDIGRALGLAVPPPPDPHLWRLVHLAVRILGTAMGPDAPPVLFAVTGGEEWVLGSEDEPVRAELVLDPVDFCLLVGGRYAPGEVPRGEAGDGTAVRDVLERAASLAWL